MKKTRGISHEPGKRDTVTGYDFCVDKPLTKIKAIRRQCLHCCGDQKDSPKEVRNCTGTDCWLWGWRNGPIDRSEKNRNLDEEGKARFTRWKCIRFECLKCMGCDSRAVRECESSHCFLWPYRMGR